jgi:RNA polymerase sigma-70 factor (ECF subfamily)
MDKDLKKICLPKTFESLFNLHYQDLKRFVFYKTQDIDMAEDIVQETFVVLWDNCSNVELSKVKSYLYTVASNLFFNIKKHEKVVSNYNSLNQNTSTKITPEFLLIEKEYLEKIENAIGELPAKQKEVFLLNRIEKKKYKEIAEELGISVKAVEKRMHLALKIMRDKIGNV